jgi:hypothetical protein
MGVLPKLGRTSLAKIGIGAERHAFLLAQPVIAEVPGLATSRRDDQSQAVRVGEVVAFSGGSGLADDQIGECHLIAPKLRLRLYARHGSRPTPATIRN